MFTAPHLDDLAPQCDIIMEDTDGRSGASSPSRSDSTSCSTPGSLTSEAEGAPACAGTAATAAGVASTDDRTAAKARRAAEKRQKEAEKRLKEQAKKAAQKAELHAKKEQEREVRKAKKAGKDDDVIFVPFVSTATPEDVARQEAKAARRAGMQQMWDNQEEPLTKHELRAYYKDMKSKPKGKTPTKEARQFADL